MAIENYYLSITEELLDKAISFTSTYNVQRNYLYFDKIRIMLLYLYTLNS